MASGFEGLDANFAQRLRALIEASGNRFWVFSGYRSVEDQQALWDQAQIDHGENARMWVAPPGKSNHNHGVAADLAWADDAAREWAHANAYKYGLHFPMSWEPWHIEPTEARANAPMEAYTVPPAGEKPVTDVSNRFDLGYQLQSLVGMLGQGLAPPEVQLPGKTPAVAGESPEVPGQQVTGVQV